MKKGVAERKKSWSESCSKMAFILKCYPGSKEVFSLKIFSNASFHHFGLVPRLIENQYLNNKKQTEGNFKIVHADRIPTCGFFVPTG